MIRLSARPARLFFDVRDYGAVFDGLSDIRPGVQAAIDACNAAGGGDVIMPAGTGLIVTSQSYGGVNSVGIAMKAGVHLRGASGATILKINPLFSGTCQIIHAADIADWSISDLDCESDTLYPDSKMRGLRVHDCSAFAIRRVRVINPAGYCLYMWGGATTNGTGIRNCTIEDFYGENAGTDIIDLKNRNNNNHGITIKGVKGNGYDLSGRSKVAVDCRGPCDVDDVELYGLMTLTMLGVRGRFGSDLEEQDIFTTQSLVGAGNFTLDGEFASGGVVTLEPPQPIGFYSDDNNSAATFTVSGLDHTGAPVTVGNTIGGPNGGTVYLSGIRWSSITQIASDAAVTNVWCGAGDENGLGAEQSTFSNIRVINTGTNDNVFETQTLGASGDFTLNGDLASGGSVAFTRPIPIVFYSPDNNSGVQFTVVGDDENGDPQTVNSITGPNNAVIEVDAFWTTITQISSSGAATNVTCGTGARRGTAVRLEGIDTVVNNVNGKNLLRTLNTGKVSADNVVSGLKAEDCKFGAQLEGFRNRLANFNITDCEVGAELKGTSPTLDGGYMNNTTDITRDEVASMPRVRNVECAGTTRIDDYAEGTGANYILGPGNIGIPNDTQLSAETSSRTLNAITDGGKTFVNDGATALVTLTLPSNFPPGCTFSAVITDTDGIAFAAAGGDSIVYNGVSYQNITSTAIGSRITLVATAGDVTWHAMAASGTWVSGGTVTQATDKSTGITLNTVSGEITTNNATLNADTSVSFTLTNSTIAAGDFVLIQHVSGGTVGSYTVTAVAASGSATITLRNITAGNLGEALVIKFLVLKAPTS